MDDYDWEKLAELIPQTVVDSCEEYWSQYDFPDENHPDYETLMDIFMQYLVFEDGEKYALLEALKLSCELKQSLIPHWVAHGVHEAVSNWSELEVKTLDDAFDVKRKGFRLKDRRAKEYLMPKVYQRVRILHKDGNSITDDLFGVVGEELGISERTASNYYYEYKKLIDKILNRIPKPNSKKF